MWEGPIFAGPAVNDDIDRSMALKVANKPRGAISPEEDHIMSSSRIVVFAEPARTAIGTLGGSPKVVPAVTLSAVARNMDLAPYLVAGETTGWVMAGSMTAYYATGQTTHPLIRLRLAQRESG